MANTVIIGIGNILLRDDGMGIHIIKELEKEIPPSAAELVDGGTSTLDMLGYFTDYPKVIIIDSLKAGLEPGTIYKIRPEDIKNYRKENLSIHDVQILDVVKMAKLLGSKPDVVIFGIEPKDISMGIGLSDLMNEKCKDIINIIKQELNIISTQF